MTKLVPPEDDRVERRLALEQGKIRRHRFSVRAKRTEAPDVPDSRFDTRRSPLKWSRLHPRRISVIYLYVAIFVIFALWVPETWLTALTHQSILNEDAVLAIVALGLVVPLAAGAFDLSIGGVMSVSAMTVSWLMVEGGWPIWASILAALGVGAVIGAVNGLLVVRVRIDSFIATLGMASVLAAVASWISGGVSISGFSDGFKEITRTDLHGINLSVVYMVVLAVVGWWVLEHVPVGRYLFATGGGREAARLAGVHTDRYVFGSLVVSASVAAFAGILETSKISSGSPGIGPPFVLPAFAAAFFGATQFHRRFNVWGTVLAVFVLASGVKGLQLAGITDLWVDDLFFGLALIIAVGLTTYRRKVHGGERRWWRREEADPNGLVGRTLRWGRPRTKASAKNAEHWWYDPEDKEGNHLKP